MATLFTKNTLIRSQDLEKRKKYAEDKHKIMEKSSKKFDNPIIVIVE